MSEKKPTPWTSYRAGTACPVCGKRTYSHGGIHPQCAVLQADAERSEELKAEQKRVAKAAKPATHWTKKKCPKCGKEVHVRCKACGCGYAFS